MSPSSVAAVVVLAAGGGTRMRSNRSKLLHEVAGRSMLSYAVAAAEATEPENLVVVVGHRRDQVEAHLAEIAPQVTTAVQDEQLGTGHAVQCGLRALGELHGDVIVTYGDVPLLTGETLQELVAYHHSHEDQVTVLTASVPNPTGYGRVVRDEVGEVARIVEELSATEDERAICEINSGIYVFDADLLHEGLASLQPDPVKGEFYLTDVVGYAREKGLRVGAHTISDLWQTEGVNDRRQLARMNAEQNRRIVEQHMLNGVTIIDPATTWIEAEVDLASDVTILPNTHLLGATSVATGAVIGPDTTLQSCGVGEGATVLRSHCLFASIGARATVGPFSYLRPNTNLAENSKVGAFVETKNTTLGAGSKLPHLTYAGDAEIGADSNIGAGTIFANYDGVNKYRTTVGSNSFVGSDSVLVAPVHIADDAYVAAGSTITSDVAEGELAVARGRQRNVAGWVERHRAAQAEANTEQEDKA